MTSDQLAWIAVLLLIVGIVAAFMQYSTIGWALVIVAVALIIYAKVRKP